MSASVCKAFLEWHEPSSVTAAPGPEVFYFDPVRMCNHLHMPSRARQPGVPMPDPARFVRKLCKGSIQNTWQGDGVLGGYALSSSDEEEEEIHPPAVVVVAAPDAQEPSEEIEEGEVLEAYGEFVRWILSSDWSDWSLVLQVSVNSRG